MLGLVTKESTVVIRNSAVQWLLWVVAAVVDVVGVAGMMEAQVAAQEFVGITGVGMVYVALLD